MDILSCIIAVVYGLLLYRLIKLAIDMLWDANFGESHFGSDIKEVRVVELKMVDGLVCSECGSHLIVEQDSQMPPFCMCCGAKCEDEGR